MRQISKRNGARSAITTAMVAFAAAAALPQAASAADQFAYISGGSTIWAWDTTTNTVSSLVNTGTSLDSLMFDAQGNIVFDSFGGGTVGRYNLGTATLSPVTGSFQGPADMALEPGGNSALIANASGTTISRVNLTTSSAVGTLAVGARPDGLAYDNTGRLFAVLGLNRVAQIDPATGAIIKTISTPNQPDGLTFDATTGMFYVASDGGGFYTVDPDLTSAVFTAIPGHVFDGIASQGNDLYFVIRGQGGLLYDLGTNTVVEISPLISGADDIAPVAGLGSNDVPEPASLALLAAGLGLLGMARRRR